LIPLTVPEVRRLLLAMAEREEHRAFRLGWSVWRRVHQAVAARCHAARRARTSNRPRANQATSPPEPPWVGLTDAEWDAVQSLLPPQHPPTGRPRHDHRRVLGGILWVVRTRASWRDLPPDCGKWETAYKRYRLWHDTGLWPQLIAALDAHDGGTPSEVAL
jgi:hypothetical protein